MLFKKVKAKDYKLVNAYPSFARTVNLMKCDSEITEIKNADLPIMDMASTGSVLTKQKVDEYSPKYEVIEDKTEKVVETPEVVEEAPKEGQLSFDDFINDFKI